MSKISKSLQYAFNGLNHLFKTERNARIQLVVAILVFFLSIYLQISPIEWIFISSVIFRVIGNETLNTIIERLCDLYTTEKNDNIKNIKDLASGYVLISTIYSVVVGCIIFIPKILTKLI